MFTKLVFKQFQSKSMQAALNLQTYTRNFRTNITKNLRNTYNRNSSINYKYIFGMSGALTLSTLNNVSILDESTTTTTTTNKWTEEHIMSEPEFISKALQFGAAFTYGDYGDEVHLNNLSNNIQFLRQIKNLIITGDTSLNEAAYAKHLMEYLNLNSFDSVEIMSSNDISSIYNDIYSDSTGVLAVYENENDNETIVSEPSNVVSIVNENTFLSNVTVLSLIAAWFSQSLTEGASDELRTLISALHKLHTYAGGVIRRTKTQCIQIANFINSKPQPQNIYILGKGFGECIAAEGINKIKEIHSNCVNAQIDITMDEIDENSAVIMLILDDENSEEMVQNARTIERKTNGKMIYITDNMKLLNKLTQKDSVIEIPNNGPLTALLAIVPIQMIAYYVGITQ